VDRPAAPRGALERIALAVLLVAAVCLAIHDVAILVFPYDLIYGEGYLLRDAALLRRGESPYAPLAPPPAVVANYPPVFPALFALATVPFGVGFFGGRLVSILATAGCALLLARVARREAAGATAALFAPLLFLADLVVYYWSPYARVDMLALLFECAALDAYHAGLATRFGSGESDGGGPREARAESARRARPLLRGHLFALLALFTRPTAVAAPLALVLTLALARDRRALARSLSALAGGAVALTLLLALATGGEFARHVLLYNANRFRWGELHRLLLDFAAPHAPLLLGAAAFFLIAPPPAPARSRRFLGLAFAFACAGALLVGKVGSSQNYFLEAVAAGALLFGVAIGRSEGPLRRLLLVVAAAGPLLATTVPWVRPLELRLNPFPAMGRTPGADDRRAGDELARVVAETPGEVLVEDAGFAVRAGKRVWAHPLILGYLEEEGRYDARPLAEMIRRREFGAIVLSYNFLSPSLRAAIGEAYRPERAVEIPGRFKYVILRPAAG